jgi:benzoyl-CoA reductase/2-hydroxyglutaryl-CoA dehydratase subunit BcrC/BadD/HgdB
MNRIDALVQGFKRPGRPVMGCFPLYPPVELLHSMGFDPVVLWGFNPHVVSAGEGDKHVQNFTCSVGRHLVDFLLSNGSHGIENVFFYNACDTLRNLPEILAESMVHEGRKAKFFHFHVPMQGLSAEPGRSYIKGEIGRLVTALEAASHIPFSSKIFRSSVELYNQMRATCIKLHDRVAAGQLSFTRYARAIHDGYLMPVAGAIERFDAMLQEPAEDLHRDVTVKVMISGILPPPPAVSDAIEQAGLVVAANDVASMQRSFQHTPRARDDPGDYYVDFYLHHCPCPTLLFTADQRIEYLLGQARRAGVDGLIFIGEKFCEYEYLEYPQVEAAFKKHGIPVLSLEVSIDDRDNVAPFKNRIDAFAELLGARGL